MNPKELQKLNSEELIKKKKQLEFEIMSSNVKFVEPLIKPGQRKSRKRIIAQILTILNERKNKDGNKR